MTSLSNMSESISMPLLAITSGAPPPRYGVACSSRPRTAGVGTTMITSFAPGSVTASSAFGSTRSCNGNPGKKRLFSRSRTSSRACSSCQVQSRTLSPRSARLAASAVPQAPAPRTATCASPGMGRTFRSFWRAVNRRPLCSGAMLARIAALALLTVSPLSCASRESVGTSSVSILGAGVVNDPANKSLRFDLLKFGLDGFCKEMLAAGVPLKMSDDEPVMGRFQASACQSQVLDEENRKSFVVQYSGSGYAASAQGGRVTFTTTGLVEYAADFLMHERALYVYFRPRVVDATAFQTKLIESELAKSALSVLGVQPDAFGQRVVDAQLRRGFTVIRKDSGETELGLGVIPLGERPYHPFKVKTEKRVVLNERTEVHRGQQDFVGPIQVQGNDQALYLTVALDGAPGIDVLVLRESTGRLMLEQYLAAPGPAALREPALLDEPAARGQDWKRYVLVPEGRYYVVLDNTSAAGRTSPPAGPADGSSARVDVLILAGDRP